jgi:hypothetical protein
MNVTIEIKKARSTVKQILVDGRVWTKRKSALNELDLGDTILTILFYENQEGNKDIQIIVNGVDETEIFKNEVKERFAGIKDTDFRDDFFKYARIEYV